jgi:hypothetical protein
MVTKAQPERPKPALVRRPGGLAPKSATPRGDMLQAGRDPEHENG